jgi:ABC-2 type transport system permease protein
MTVWRPYVLEAKYECLRAFRAPAFARPIFLLPVAFYLFFGVVLQMPTRTAEIDRFLFAGFSVMGVMGPGLFAFGVFVAVEREQGLMKLKRALPAPPSAYILARMLMTALAAAVVIVTVTAAALLTNKVILTVGEFGAFAAILTAGSVPFSAIGLLIGSVVGGRAAPAFVNLLYLPMIYLSGFLIPLPRSFDALTRLSPAYHLDRLALGAVGAQSDHPVVHVMVLLGVTFVCGGLAIRRLSRSE